LELWKSDGTTAGTSLVKDIYTGAYNASPANLLAVNGTLYFSATDGTNGRELWKSDGTAAGTVIVKDIYTGTLSAIAAAPPSNYYFTNINDTVFFGATDGTSGQELWKTDGTSAGTVMVGDINPGAGDSKPLWFTKINNTIYFSAESTTSDAELWKYDGTTGTSGIYSLINNHGFSIFPNPTTGRFTVKQNNLQGPMNIEIFNVIGEQILVKQNVNEIDLSNSPKGIYFVKMYNGTKVYTSKITVQ